MRRAYYLYASLARDLGRIWREGLESEQVSRRYEVNIWREGWRASGGLLLAHLYCWNDESAQDFIETLNGMRGDGFEGELLLHNQEVWLMIGRAVTQGHPFYGFSQPEGRLFLLEHH